MFVSFELVISCIFESCGSKEYPKEVEASVQSLKAAGYNAHSFVSDGTAHEFLTWRRSFYHLAQLLFRW